MYLRIMQDCPETHQIKVQIEADQLQTHHALATTVDPVGPE